MHRIDIIVPVRDEEQNLDALVRRIDTTMQNAHIPYRAIFVVDPSSDSTLEKLAKMSSFYPIFIHPKVGKPGKAYSILEGVRLATSDYVVMIDGDLQYPPEKIP